MIKTYELINGTLREVVQGNEPKVELKWFLDQEFKRSKPTSEISDLKEIKLIDKGYSYDGLDLIQAKGKSCTLLYLGTYNEPDELKGIEVVNVLTTGGYFVPKKHAFKSPGTYTVTLIARNYCDDLDLFVKDTEGIKVLCLGRWNDGIVK